MSYFIFLKYLDSLEDFRKNPHATFLLNLLVQNSKALVYSKIQFLFKKELSSDFSPSGPAPPVLARLAYLTQAALVYLPKVYFLRLCAFRQRRLYSLTSLPCGPCPSASSPSPRRPISLMSPLLLVASGHPAPPGLQHRDVNRSHHSTTRGLGPRDYPL
jgi:hypothetical protein